MLNEGNKSGTESHNWYLGSYVTDVIKKDISMRHLQLPLK